MGFLRRLGLDHVEEALSAFWPARGPQWDALGLAGDKVILVEAKAHLLELVSSCSAGAVSRRRIDDAFRLVCEDLGISDSQSWTTGYYQLANRIAHLWFLRRSGINAHLLLVSFINDADMKGPSEHGVWMQAYRDAETVLGIKGGHSLETSIHHVYPDVGVLAG